MTMLKLAVSFAYSLLLLHPTVAFSAPPSKVVATAVAGGVSSPPSSFVSAKCSTDGTTVQIQFPNTNDDAVYEFHAMWLRDACRDDHHVAEGAGERILTQTPVGPVFERVDPTQLRATRVEVNNNNNNEIIVHWNDENSQESRFSVSFLQHYAPIVARRRRRRRMQEAAVAVNDGIESNNDDSDGWSKTGENIPTWLEPYTGYPEARAPKASEIRLWTNQEGPDFLRFDHGAVMSDNAELLKLLEALFEDGVALVDNVPTDESDEAVELHEFVSHALGGLQKDPTRNEANWKIVSKPDAASISYNPSKRLYQHTDSSIPPHGIPGLVLSMHYCRGYGANTLTDGYAVAAKIRETDPEAYKLLCTYGYDGERDFAASRVDSTQDIAKGLVIRRKHPIFHTDPDGDLLRLQYNEVFRMPLTLDFDVFPKWYAAFSKFVSMVHSEEYQRTVPMQENTILLMNNWRVLHGRAGNRASPDRHLVGGTIVREAVYSRAMQLARLVHKKN